MKARVNFLLVMIGGDNVDFIYGAILITLSLFSYTGKHIGLLADVYWQFIIYIETCVEWEPESCLGEVSPQVDKRKLQVPFIDCLFQCCENWLIKNDLYFSLASWYKPSTRLSPGVILEIEDDIRHFI
jgi:hypothetical protein